MPCAKRNASGVANALVSADLALSGIFSEIPFDEVVEAMYKVGKALPSTLRETGAGRRCNHPDRTGDEGKNLRQRRRRICLQRGLRLLADCAKKSKTDQGKKEIGENPYLLLFCITCCA